MHKSAGTGGGGVRPSVAYRQSGCWLGGGETPCAYGAYAAEIERLEVAVATGMEEYEYGHHLTIEHEAWAVTAAFVGTVQRLFFSVQEQNICRTHQEYKRFLLKLREFGIIILCNKPTFINDVNIE